MSKNVNKRTSINRAKLFTELCICAVIIGVGAYFAKIAIDNTEPLGTAPYVESMESSDISATEPDEQIDPNKIIFQSNSVPTKEKFIGDLILVNHQYQFFSGDEELVVINEKNSEKNITCFVGEDNNTKTLQPVYNQLSQMLVDFYNATGVNDIVITAAYRTAERQQELYDQDLAENGTETSTKVALPGHSEHESGFAIDLSTTTSWSYDGTGEYNWINENCWKYGFILRYPEDKIEITKIQYEPWHYRYVGVPHAYYIKKNDLCLEEYIDLLKDYAYGQNHLEIVDENGNSYEVYYVSSDDGSETTPVPVPTSLKYDISGNNVDGFIVTVYKGNTEDSSSSESQESSAE